jgi:membrane peptidoglycan carboxypeptidase
LRIEDGRGQVVYDAQRDRLPPANALDPRIAYILTDILDDDQARIPAFGTNHPLAPAYPAAVKTGTTNDFRDNWTLGYTPGLVVGVWFGNTDGHPMRNTSGLTGAAPIWRQIMDTVLFDPNMANSLRVDGFIPPTAFNRPNGIEERQVCLPRGAGGSQCGAARTELFITGGPQRGTSRLGYNPDLLSAPGAWVLTVLPLPASAAQQISLPALSNGYQPPLPAYCVVNSGTAVPGASTRLFLPVPPHYPDEVRARLWGQQNGWNTMAPPVVCPVSVVQQARQQPPTAPPPPPAEEVPPVEHPPAEEPPPPPPPEENPHP